MEKGVSVSAIGIRTSLAPTDLSYERIGQTPLALAGYRGPYEPRVPVLKPELDAIRRQNALERAPLLYVPSYDCRRSPIDGAVLLHGGTFRCLI